MTADTFKDKAAAFILPFLVSCVVIGTPAAYAMGVAKGSDTSAVAALTKRVEKAETDHDTLMEIKADLKWIREAMQAMKERDERRGK